MRDPYDTFVPIVPTSDTTTPGQPRQIGRYRIEKLLGKGGFGLVYLAHDDQLNRAVAIKVPRAETLPRPEDSDAYLAEARIVASLDHPNIVPVHDVGTTPDGLCYVVSKVIEGNDLGKAIEQFRPSLSHSVEMIAAVAEALHYAHRKGLVHRDIKPGNILIDSNGKPHVADFGLALKEEDFGKGTTFAGTPAYMSPEQARGEGHRVDGRSDIFSLGVVFYELLVGRRPFKGDTLKELLEQIAKVEARPPRQIDDQIPKELERICLKALAKRASERYLTAADMADDLRHFQPQSSAPVIIGGQASSLPIQPPSTMKELGTTATSPPIETKPPVKIVPKGLRSFDAHDADFFLELLPGPRDRNGLPDSIRFWKTRIEETDSDKTFPVGLIYGPSGCGKSSLVKAGLLPRLSEHVDAIYVEATSDDTEARLLIGIRKHCPTLPGTMNLIDALATLRHGRDMSVEKKVVVLIDQFEQWLLARSDEPDSQLVQALRQCDGGRVQCIVMVRDDFWMAVTRFMRQLEIRPIEGQNSAAVDLFQIDHAKNVLAAFGSAFGKFHGSTHDPSRESQFVEQAVSDLAQDGRIISVRLALFAEMMKGKPWTPAALKEVGGAEGIGVRFLDETFSLTTAPPEHRYHQAAAKAILHALLPDSGTEIKGHMRSRQELLEASSYGDRLSDFDDLIRILDNEIRLITPTDPNGIREGETLPTPIGMKYYQLTHDYLVPSLREWLTKERWKTWRGRAELRLEERTALVRRLPGRRYLPKDFDWLSILIFTKHSQWTAEQKDLMRRANIASLPGAIVVLLVAWFLSGLVFQWLTTSK